ncbi:MAG: transposase [Betaproteobacteria bacterium]
MQSRCAALCRAITRPALSDERVQLNAAGQVELKLKTPWRDGTTHRVMSPLEFMQRLAARATEGRPSGTRAAAAAASHPVPRRAGPERQAAGAGGATRAWPRCGRGGRAGQRGCRHRRRGRDGSGPAAPDRLGTAAQARL